MSEIDPNRMSLKAQGHRLKLAIKNSGLNRGQMAAILGVSGPAVSHWCKGVRDCGEKLGKIASSLSVSEEWLRTGRRPPKWYKAAVSALDVATDEERAAIERVESYRLHPRETLCLVEVLQHHLEKEIPAPTAADVETGPGFKRLKPGVSDRIAARDFVQGLIGRLVKPYDNLANLRLTRQQQLAALSGAHERLSKGIVGRILTTEAP